MKIYILLALCGLVLAEDAHIVDGDPVTDADKYPWQGSLRNYGSHSCGLSLISENWGLTAAHCVQGTPTSRYTFMFGSLSRTSNNVVVGAKRIINHEDYNRGPGAFPNDVALIEFDEPVHGTNIEAVPLNNDDPSKERNNNTDCWITGWGRLYGGGPLPNTLQEANIEVFTNSVCRRSWGSSVNDGHICIGGGEMTSCNGDSGGPLVCKFGGRFELVGATSWGPSGCRKTPPSAYSRVAFFRDWIKTNSGV